MSITSKAPWVLMKRKENKIRGEPYHLEEKSTIEKKRRML